jgi:putative redox protein
MEVHVRQLEGVRFAIDARNHTIISDQPVDNGGADSGMTPPELLLASLASCAGYYAAEYLRTRKLAESGVEVSVTAEKVKSPARLDNFRITVLSPVHLDEQQEQAMLNSVRHCLVHNTLLSSPTIEISLSATTRELVK